MHAMTKSGKIWMSEITPERASVNCSKGSIYSSNHSER